MSVDTERKKIEAKKAARAKRKRRAALHRALNIAKNIFTWLVVIIAVAMMIFTIVSVTAFDRNDRDLLGYKAFIVRSDSMSATDFKAGDLILVKEVDPSTLRAGDIIAFISQNAANFGEVVTHKIRTIKTNERGEPAFATYGTTTGADDETAVTYEYVLGKYHAALPGIGSFFTFLKTTPGYICCILLPFLLLIVLQGLNSVKLFQQYRKEQRKQIKAERDQIASERAEAQRMLAELQRLRAEMGLTPQTNYSDGDSRDNAATYTADR